LGPGPEARTTIGRVTAGDSNDNTGGGSTDEKNSYNVVERKHRQAEAFEGGKKPLARGGNSSGYWNQSRRKDRKEKHNGSLSRHVFAGANGNDPRSYSAQLCLYCKIFCTSITQGKKPSPSREGGNHPQNHPSLITFS